jgi:hypothetical protein
LTQFLPRRFRQNGAIREDDRGNGSVATIHAQDKLGRLVVILEADLCVFNLMGIKKCLCPQAIFGIFAAGGNGRSRRLREAFRDDFFRPQYLVAPEEAAHFSCNAVVLDRDIVLPVLCSHADSSSLRAAGGRPLH